MRTSANNHRMTVAGLVGVALLCLTATVSAHTVQICWRDVGNVTTFYAGTYHSPYEAPSPIGGIIIDGQYNPFSGWIVPSDLPADAQCWAHPAFGGCSNAVSIGNPDGLACSGVVHFQTFTSAYAFGSHTLDFSRSTAVEYPWQNNFPPQTFGGGACNDADFDGLCNDVDPCPLDFNNDADSDGLCADVDNCPLDYNPDQTDINSNGQGDICEGIVCGNGLVQGSEECDDGNTAGGDGCSSICTIELADSPPVANAGTDRAVNEGQLVVLDGTASNDPDGDALSYSWSQTGGTLVALSDATAAQPTFIAPMVSIGGETLSFDLTVTANGASSSDSVSISVVNINHVPVAEAGPDQSIAEGAPVSLDGSDSYDADSDPISYSWVQTGGAPLVTLVGANTATPSFTAPIFEAGGAPGVVATLVFTLTVDDGFPPDAPGDGPASDSIAIEVTNVNNDPVADAGADKTINEDSALQLNGSNSSDPDSDPLSYSWSQVGGTAVALNDTSSATPAFTTPFVSAGGEDLTFQLSVDDGYGGTDSDLVIVHVQNANDPPNASLARPTVECLWPPNHMFIEVGIAGVSDPEDNATITIDGVSQDEMTNGLGDGDTAIDAIINGDGTVQLRAERAGGGDGRIYRISFTAADLEGSDSGEVTVCVPHNRKSEAIDSGGTFDSTQ